MANILQRLNVHNTQLVRCLIFSAVILFSTVACNALGTSAPEQQTHIIYGLTESVIGIDPHIHTSDELDIILRQIYDTLIYRHPETSEFVPGLAESWEISPDRLDYTFYLRQNVTFHDGIPFTAQAVADNLQRILDPNMATEHSRQLLGPIVSYQVLDAHTIKLTLSRPFEPLLDSLSQASLSIASPTAFNEYADAPLRYQYHQVGTGAFELIEYLPEDRIVIRRNPDYQWYPSFYTPPVVNAVPEIEFRFFRDVDTRLNELEQGNAQIMGGLLPSDARSLVNDPDVTVIPTTIAGQPFQFYFNTTLAPTDNLAVRQALIYAANRTSIAETVYGGFAPVAWGPISANSLFYNRGVRNVYAYNLQQAQALLTQAGYTDADSDGILEKDSELLTITINYAPENLLPEVTQQLAEQWESIGIDVQLQPVPGQSAVLQAASEGKYNLIALNQAGIDPYILNANYISERPQNWTNFSNPELDTVLLGAEQTSDLEERRLSYGRAQAIIMEQALILPISDMARLNAHVAGIEGLSYDRYGAPLLYNVSYQR
jgi:peptide/nickel transport system substrate-binding protein